MGFFKKILEKPWLPPEGNVVDIHTSYFTATNRKVALILFLCVVGGVVFPPLLGVPHAESVQYGLGFDPGTLVNLV